MEVRTLKELVEKYGLPLSVKRQSWFGDYYFCAEGVDHSGFVSGKIYNNGMPHKMQIFADTEIMELYKTDVGEIVERNNDESGINPNGLDTNKSNYKKGETKLFVTKNGNVVSAYFDRFEFKNGKTLIYVTCEGEQNSGFYPFPETTYVFSNKDDANHVIDKENRSIIDATSANATVLAFQSMPLAKEVSDSVSIEMEREKAYHKEVDDDLRNTLRNHQANLDEENQRLYTVNYAFREECAAAREEGYALDLQAQISHQIKADNAKRKINRFEKDISRVKNIRKKPYVGRVDCGKNANDLHTAYIGDCDIPGYVVDWRNSNIGNAYYHYETLMNSKDVFLALRRTFTIDNGVFERYEDVINLYNGEGYKKCESDYVVSADGFLTKLLMESRLDKTTHDITKTIQGEQYDIITSDFSRNAVVNGCAGSGKTMIMYHRLSYMAYNYKNVLQREFDPNNVYIVSPSSFFDISNNELLKKLSIDKIYQAPFFDQVENLICKYCSNKNIFAFQGIMSLKKDTVTDISKTMVLNKAGFNSFLSELEKLDNNLELKKEYNKWIVETANYILSSQGFKTLPKSFMPSTQAQIEYLFKSHDYYLNKCFIRKSDEDKTTYFYPSAITSISYKDIVDKFYSDITNNKKDIQRNKRIQKHIGLLKASLSINTETRLGAIENKISEFATILNNATVFQRMIALITVQRLLECLIESKSSNRDYILKCVFIYKKYFSNATASEYSVFILRALSEKFGEAIKEESLIFVDEFQNYSPFELDCLKGVFAAPIFNLFGDYDQRIED